MDLWIRSQNKKKFIQCKSIVIGGYVGHKNETTLWCEQYSVGSYPNEERALEILDEIQNILKPRVIISNYNPVMTDSFGNIISDFEEPKIEQLSTFVYEMPKD